MTISFCSPERIEFKIANKSGVYFLKRDGKVIYIGKSSNVFSRIFGRDHSTKGFDEVEIHWLPAEQLLAYEKNQIATVKPPLNCVKRRAPHWKVKLRN